VAFTVNVLVAGAGNEMALLPFPVILPEATPVTVHAKSAAPVTDGTLKLTVEPEQTGLGPKIGCSGSRIGQLQ